MTYKKPVPPIVFSRWTALNKDYAIELSLDADCIHFLEKHFNRYIADLFRIIPRGMFKADLWRLCKLYINGGIYADVDLVPHIDIDSLDKRVSFYSCLSIDENSVFQAFMVTFSPPRNPLILNFLLSFLLNQPYNNLTNNGPCYDMFRCVQYNMNGARIQPETLYTMSEVKIPVLIGSSETNMKMIDLHYFPSDISYTIRICNSPYNDRFAFDISGSMLYVTRIDNSGGWGHAHSCDICIQSNESMYFFREHVGPRHNWVTSFVAHKGVKILDSRDLTYYNNNGW